MLGRSHELAQGGDHLRVLAELLANVLPLPDGRPRVAQFVGLDLGDAPTIGPPLQRHGRDRGTSLEHAHQLLPSLVALEQLHHGRQRLGIGPLGFEHRAPVGERPVGIAELGRELCCLTKHLVAQRSRPLELRQPLEHRQPLGGTLARRQQLVEAVGGAQRTLGLGIARLQHARVQLDGSDAVVQGVVAQVRGIEQQGHALRAVGARVGRGDQGRRRQVVPARAATELPQLLACVGVAGIADQQRAVLVHGLGVATEDGEPAAELALDGALLVGLGKAERLPEHADHVVGPVDDLVGLAQQAERLAPSILGAGVELEDGLEVATRLGIIRALTDQRPELLERLAEIAQPFQAADRDLETGRARLGHRQLRQQAAPQLDQVLPALVALEQTLERGHELGVGGIEHQQLADVVRGSTGLVREVLGYVGRVVEQAAAFVLVGRLLQQPIVDRKQLGPLLSLGEHHGQPLEGPFGLDVALHDDAEQPGQPLGAVEVPDLAELHRALGQGAPDVLAERALEQLAVQIRDIVGPLQGVGQLFDVTPGSVVVRGTARGRQGREKGLLSPVGGWR